jgi:hypothetical protein
MSKVARTSLIFLSAKINSFHCVFGKKKRSYWHLDLDDNQGRTSRV